MIYWIPFLISQWRLDSRITDIKGDPQQKLNHQQWEVAGSMNAEQNLKTLHHQKWKLAQ